MAVLAASPAWSSPVEDTPVWTHDGGGYFGQAIASVPDFNGDGNVDLIVGNPYNAGNFKVYTGDGTGSFTQSFSQSGGQGWYRRGSAVGAGDFNNDGLSDVATGIPGIESVQVWYGTAGTPSTYADFHYQSPVNEFGMSIDVGDTNGDGIDDLLVSGPAQNQHTYPNGGARLFCGTASGPSATECEWNLFDAQAGNLAGQSSALCDFDNDGFDDVAVGAPWHDDTLTNQGRVQVFYGSASAPSATEDWVVYGAETDGEYGDSVAAGDINGDGFCDLVVGAPEEGSGGTVYLYAGGPSGLDTTALWTRPTAFSGVRYGETVGVAPDVDGDGFDEILVGAPFYSSGHDEEGAAFLYLGSFSGPPWLSNWQFESNTDYARLGWEVEGLGDINGDGWGDIALGGEWAGQAWVFLGDPPDSDSDGSVDPLDCNDSDPNIFPGAPESCDAIDSDCDDSLVDEDTNTDGDTEPDCIDANDDNDPSLDVDDCAPLDDSIYVGAPESCDVIDSDCDNSIVDEDTDTDGDLEPDCVDDNDDNDPSLDVDDCGPTDNTIYVGAPESCDLIDSDCDLSIVDEDTDTDGDLTPDCVDDNDDGDASLDVDDCAPLDNTIYEGAPELCDAIDSDCDLSLVDEDTDTDGDLEPDCTDTDDDNDIFPDAVDCGPLDPTIYPAAPESCDLIDSDCDNSIVDEDTDTDGDLTPDCVDEDDDGDASLDVDDCAPLDASINPSATDIPDDTIDQDCSGADTVTCYADNDGDGFGAGAPILDASGACSAGLDVLDTDCEDDDASINPGATEVCDAIDQNCDGDLIEAFANADNDADPDCIDTCVDADGDGLGAPAFDLSTCADPTTPDADDTNATACGDTDGDTCDDCSNGPFDPTNDGVDTDLDGECDASDLCTDADQDGLGDPAFPLDECDDPNTPDADDNDGFACGDTDNDTCDDCAFGSWDPADDGDDTDEDGTCDDGDLCTDLDGDGLGDPAFDMSDCADPTTPDTDDTDNTTCGDTDNDTCDDCAEGPWDPSNDGDDTDEDGECDAGDLCTDADEDGLGDGAFPITGCGDTTTPDADDDDPNACGDTDGDTCDDCTNGLFDPANDGDDLDGDGLCDDGDDDADGDGATTVLDCDDGDASVFPNAPELCDLIDSDCDGDLVDGELDTDGDGDPDCIDDDDDGDGTLDGDDCAPLDASIHPAATELCDGIDQDCDGDLAESFDDTDTDGDPDCHDDDDDNDGDADLVDCASLDPTVGPSQPEVCDGIDNDCDGALPANEVDSNANSVPDCAEDDLDGDGHTADVDCDDNDPTIYPGAFELCDGVDQDCDSTNDALEADGDGDGFRGCEGDCDDDDATLTPEDSDGDGFSTCDDDCDDGDALLTPADDDSDGFSTCDDDCDDDDALLLPADDDGDGFTSCDGDCDDTDGNIHPDAAELCDGTDNDCDGDTDEDEEFVDWYADTDGDGFGDPAAPHQDNPTCENLGEGWVQDDGDCDDGDASVNPDAEEACDGIDNDCDGDSDEDLEIVDWWPDTDNDGFGDPTAPYEGNPTCDNLGDGWVQNDEDCDDGDASVNPEAEEVCDGIDNDCDSTTGPDEDDSDGDSFLGCDDDCDDDDPELNPSQGEEAGTCSDGLDNDCDGLPDGDDPQCVGIGCTDCAQSIGGGSGMWIAALIGLLGIGVRRRRGLWLAVLLVGCGPGLTPDWDTAGLPLLDTTVDTQIEGASTSYQLGRSVAGGGDVNGDGFDDVIVGERNLNGRGRACVYRGSASGLNETSSWCEQGSSNNEELGAAVAMADFDGDDFDDVAFTVSGTSELRAAYGSGSGLGAAAAFNTGTIGGSTNLDLATGDIENDGFEDLVLGAPQIGDGLVKSWSGGQSGLTADNWLTYNPGSGSYWGSGVALGDVTGDGYDDLIVGYERSNFTASNQGTVAVFEGSASGLDTNYGWSWSPTGPNTYLGNSVAVVGDVNGDGVGDWAAACTLCGGGGQTYVWFGEFGQLPSASAPGWTGPSGPADGGGDVNGVGDTNLDGIDDFLVGDPNGGTNNAGTAHLFLGTLTGPAGSSDWSINGQSATNLGTDLDGAGDVNGDGVPDLIIGNQYWTSGHSERGRALVYLGLGDDLDGDGSPLPDDCDDTNPDINPSATDTPDDGIDQDCDGFDTVTCWPDSDLDGYGDGTPALEPSGACLAGFVANDTDCDDSTALRAPNLSEVCDGIDNDCDLAVPTNEADGDGDGTLLCDGDCNDSDATIHPSATELCDTIDQDCDGDVLESFDDIDIDDTPDCVDTCVDSDLDGLGNGTNGNTGCDDPTTDTDDADATFCGDTDNDTCEDCWSGPWNPDDDGLDTDSDGLCNDGDPDDDGDCMTDVDETACAADPLVPDPLFDIDGDCTPDCIDTCVDADNDGLGDGNYDLSGCADPINPDPDDTTAESCGDSDGDTCDDCSSGPFDPSNDGPDHDNDGLCDDGDTCSDLDQDGIGASGFDTSGCADPLISDLNDADDRTCGDTDGDGCDDCVSLDFDPANDGLDGDSDGVCDVSDDCTDDDGDGLGNAAQSTAGCLDPTPDADDTDPNACGDRDSDTCDDCSSGTYDEANDGPDLDGDGLCDAGDDDADGDGIATPLDCDDADATINPTATEACDAIDSDCDGSLVDEDLDTDGDGDPDCIDEDDDEDGSLDGDDCAPLDPAIHPAATEVCDTVDDDCDGDILESFDDTDGDLDPDCTDPDDDDDGDLDGDDCAPLDPDQGPSVAEVCDGIDNDCDGAPGADEVDTNANGTLDCNEDDLDGDGATALDDCDDTDASLNLLDADSDGYDTCAGDCDDSDATQNLDDGDGDGFSSCTGDCDDAVPTLTPEDADGDGFSSCEGDCDDGDDTLNLSDVDGDQSTTCEGDCDDDDPTLNTADADLDGVTTCDGDCDDDEATVGPDATEACNGVDDDCDGDVDEGLPSTSWFADTDGDGFGDPDAPFADNPTCADAGDGFVPNDSDCDDSDADRYPSADEVCDGFDNNCDPSDDPDEEDADADSFLACDQDCDDDDPNLNPSQSETEDTCSDGLDNDCDGLPDGDDPQCATVSCTDCASSMAPNASPLLALLLLIRRRRYPAPS